MKVKFLPSVLVVSLAGFLWLMPYGNAQAQEKALFPNDLLDANHSDLTSTEIAPTENDPKAKTSSRDSASLVHNKQAVIALAPAKTKTQEHKPAPTNKEEDDALSFNFLYYIIQKFKISDLIDE